MNKASLFVVVLVVVVVHDGHVGGVKQKNDFPLGTSFIFMLLVFFLPTSTLCTTWPSCSDSIV